MRISGRPLLLQLAWHALAVLLFLFLPVLKWKAPWWELPRKEVFAIAVLLAGYGAAALAVMVFARAGTPRAFSRGLALALGTFGLFMLVLLLTRLDAPRYLLLPIFLAIVALAPFVVAPRTAQVVGIAVLALVLLGVAGLGGRVAFAPPKKTAKVVATNVKTAFYVLRVDSHEGAVEVPATRGGGLDHLGDRILLGTGDGLSIRCVSRATICRPTGSQSACRRTAKSLRPRFSGSATAPRVLTGYVEATARGPDVALPRRRRDRASRRQRRAHLRVPSFLEADRNSVSSCACRSSTRRSPTSSERARPATWQTIFETQPCVPLFGEGAMRGKNPFRGEEIGGRLVLLDAKTLLLSLGDHGFSGIEGAVAFAQDPRVSYGKTIRIDLRTQRARSKRSDTAIRRDCMRRRMAASGKRARCARRRRAEPARAGRELRLARGRPTAPITDRSIWALSKQQGHHVGFQQPVYSWLPGIGSRTWCRSRRERFPVWRGDLLIGALGARGLFRVVLDGDRAVVTEPIPLQKRVRDLSRRSTMGACCCGRTRVRCSRSNPFGIGRALTFSTACLPATASTTASRIAWARTCTTARSQGGERRELHGLHACAQAARRPME